MNKALTILLAIFVSDMLMPFGVALGLLYCICIFLVVSESRNKILIVTTLASIFTVVKLAVYYSNGTPDYILYNRIITIVTLWITAIIAIKFRLLQNRQQLIAKIEQKNKESEQFIYIASHDLNEPIRTVKSMAELLERRNAGQLDEDGKKFLHYIHNSAERMSSLIQSLLEYGRIGRHSVKKPVDCNLLVQGVKEDLHFLLSQTGSVLSVKKLPVINGFENELRLLFQNLIVNAVKFRKENHASAIHITAKPVREGWLFSVSDNGIGISPENYEKIFTIFKRLHSIDEYEGTGIGLAHCRKIVEMHHGTIWVKSHKNKGTTFYFTIPTD